MKAEFTIKKDEDLIDLIHLLFLFSDVKTEDGKTITPERITDTVKVTVKDTEKNIFNYLESIICVFSLHALDVVVSKNGKKYVIRLTEEGLTEEGESTTHPCKEFFVPTKNSPEQLQEKLQMVRKRTGKHIEGTLTDGVFFSGVYDPCDRTIRRLVKEICN